MPEPEAAASEYALVRALAEAGSAEEAVQRLLEVIGTRFDWAAGELWLAADDDGVLRFGDDWSADDPALLAFRVLGRRLSFAPGIGLPGRVWATREAVWVPDITTDPNFPRVEAAARAGLHAGVGVPVPGPSGLLGAMGFFATEVREPDPAQLEGLQAAARQIGAYLARIRAEERLRASEEISGSIFEAALDCIVTMDADGLVLDFNPAAESTFGYAREAVRGRRLADLIVPEELREAHTEAVRRYLATRRPAILNRRLELTGMRSDGSLLPVELTVTRLGTSEPPTFAGFVRDLTDRRRTEERIAQLLEREQAARAQAEAAERSARGVSEALQRSLLPPHLPDIPGLELGALYEAASEDSMVGGDFYDVFPVAGDRWGIVIGDVSGKGAAAASLTALVRYTLRTAAIRERDPRAVLRVVNEALLREPRDNAYCTLAYAVLQVADAVRLCVAVAGHPPPLVAGADGTTRTAGRPGTLLGAVAEPAFERDDVVLERGETLLLYTDGMTEAQTDGGLLGEAGLSRLVSRCAGRPPGALLACLAAAVHDRDGRGVTDDIAMLALRPVGAPERVARPPRRRGSR